MGNHSENVHAPWNNTYIVWYGAIIIRMKLLVSAIEITVEK